MKNLNQFNHFDFRGFSAAKTLVATHCGPWVDYETKEHKGTKIEVVIAKDDTVYQPGKDGAMATNLYEKFAIKVAKDVSVPVGSTVEIIGGTASIYGDYRNQLSVKADDIKVIQAPATAQSGGGKNG